MATPGEGAGENKLDVIQALAGALALSVIHGLMPDHWIPLTMVSRTEKWSSREALLATVLVGIPHTIGSILLGIIVGLIGYELSSYELVIGIVAPVILVILGLIYVFLDFKSSHQRHNQKLVKTGALSGKSKFAVIVPLATALFFSPCVSIVAYYFVVGGFGWLGIAAVSAIYPVGTIAVMRVMVTLGLKGVKKIKWHFLEQHERLVTGIVLIILGTLIYFVEI